MVIEPYKFCRTLLLNRYHLAEDLCVPRGQYEQDGLRLTENLCNDLHLLLRLRRDIYTQQARLVESVHEDLVCGTTFC